MSEYEGMFIIKSDLDKDAKKKVEDFISGAITKEGGSVKDFSEWGKNRLAYRIKKQKEGLYIMTHFFLTPEKLEKIQKAYNLNENILKTLILVDESVKERGNFNGQS